MKASVIFLIILAAFLIVASIFVVRSLKENAAATVLGQSSGKSKKETGYTDPRTRMVSRQIEARGIRNEKVLNAFRKVPRHRFVPPAYRSLAYADHPLPIGFDQTISQPYIVALMTAEINLKPNDRVLEIGTGSGYQAAVLGEIVAHVYTIEIVESLGRSAAALLKELGYANVDCRIADGYKGWPEAAPFDAVIVTAAPDDVPPKLLEQLAKGGRMILPVGSPGSIQKLIKITKDARGNLHETFLIPVRFVPMVKGDD